MKNPYLFASGRVSALEKDLLQTRTWQMLLSASDAVEAGRLLADTWYGRFPGLAQGAFDEVFEAALIATEQELIELAEDPWLVRGILHRRDARNARYLWKASLCGGAVNPSIERMGLVEPSVILAALGIEEARAELPGAMASTAAELTALPSPTPLAIDRIMDRMAVRLETEELPSMEPGFRRYLEALIDIRNLTTCMRAMVSGGGQIQGESLFLEGGSAPGAGFVEASRNGALPEFVADIADLEKLGPVVRDVLASRSFLEFERESERVLLNMLDAGSFALFGPSPLAAFLMKREMEISHLRILLAAKTAGLDKTRLQKRLPRG